MRVASSSVVCDRVRAQVSLELDGEFSEFERLMLAAHLARCPECHAYEADVVAFTHSLRAAPAELPRKPVVVSVRRSRRASFSTAQLGAAAAVAIAVLGVLGQLGGSDAQRAGTAQSVTMRNLFQTSWQPERELAQIAKAPAVARYRKQGLLTAI